MQKDVDKKVIRTQPHHAGQRLDAWLHDMLPQFSRALLQRAIREGKVLVDTAVGKPSQKLVGCETVVVATNLQHQPLEDKPQKLDLSLVHTDADIIVLNKPAGLVVHPGAGNREGTLLNALLYAFPELASLPRAGLVHRLDKDTSGLLVVARNLDAYTTLVDMLKLRQLSRIYNAVCHGHLPNPITLNFPIGRNPYNRCKMAVTPRGKPARTWVTPISHLDTATLLEVQLDTGRTHQIRVHLQHAGFPLVGDRTYAVKRPCFGFTRQALHAARLTFDHPRTGVPCLWQAPIPPDMSQLISSLTLQASGHGSNAQPN